MFFFRANDNQVGERKDDPLAISVKRINVSLREKMPNMCYGFVFSVGIDIYGSVTSSTYWI